MSISCTASNITVEFEGSSEHANASGTAVRADRRVVGSYDIADAASLARSPNPSIRVTSTGARHPPPHYLFASASLFIYLFILLFIEAMIVTHRILLSVCKIFTLGGYLRKYVI